MPGSRLGEYFSVINFGESHGPAIGCVIDGCPPGMELSQEDIQKELDRRRPGTSRHVTQRKESDTVEILSGVYQGKTTGTPIALLIRNEEKTILQSKICSDRPTLITPITKNSESVIPAGAAEAQLVSQPRRSQQELLLRNGLKKI